MLKRSKASTGFTLVEIIIGIVVLGIALVVITGALGPLYKQSTDPWHQVRAAELGHSFLNEIMARSFDEHSDRAGGEYRCDADPAVEVGAEACTTPALISGYYRFPQDCTLSCESREDFDDVDDFDGFNSDGGAIANILNEELLQSYRNYQVQVTVIYDGDRDGAMAPCAVLAVSPCLAERRAKLITVIVTTPSGQDIAFAAYKGNW